MVRTKRVPHKEKRPASSTHSSQVEDSRPRKAFKQDENNSDSGSSIQMIKSSNLKRYRKNQRQREQQQLDAQGRDDGTNPRGIRPPPGVILRRRPQAVPQPSPEEEEEQEYGEEFEVSYGGNDSEERDQRIAGWAGSVAGAGAGEPNAGVEYDEASIGSSSPSPDGDGGEEVKDPEDATEEGDPVPSIETNNARPSARAGARTRAVGPAQTPNQTHRRSARLLRQNPQVSVARVPETHFDPFAHFNKAGQNVRDLSNKYSRAPPGIIACTTADFKARRQAFGDYAEEGDEADGNGDDGSAGDESPPAGENGACNGGSDEEGPDNEGQDLKQEPSDSGSDNSDEDSEGEESVQGREDPVASEDKNMVEGGSEGGSDYAELQPSNTPIIRSSTDPWGRIRPPQAQGIPSPPRVFPPSAPVYGPPFPQSGNLGPRRDDTTTTLYLFNYDTAGRIRPPQNQGLRLARRGGLPDAPFAGPQMRQNTAANRMHDQPLSAGQGYVSVSIAEQQAAQMLHAYEGVQAVEGEDNEGKNAGDDDAEGEGKQNDGHGAEDGGVQDDDASDGEAADSD